MEGKHKIFAFVDGPFGEDDVTCVAVGDDGVTLASHICSNESWLPFDMGITSSRHHSQYNAHFGEGKWDIEHVREPASHPGLQAALALSK